MAIIQTYTHDQTFHQWTWTMNKDEYAHGSLLGTEITRSGDHLIPTVRQPIVAFCYEAHQRGPWAPSHSIISQTAQLEKSRLPSSLHFFRST